MTTIRRLALRLLAVLRFSQTEADLTREIDAHLQLIEDEHVAAGMNRADARLAARKTFGGVEQAKERHRDARSFRPLDDLRIDFKLGARMLVKYPGLSIIGGAGLAVAIAVGAGFFAFFYAFLYSTLPLDEGDRIVALENWNVEKNNEERRALHDLHTWRAEMKTVEEISAFRTVARNLIVPGGSTEPARIAQMTASAFRVARVGPILGRPLVDADELPGAPPVVVIGYDVWQSRFQRDPSIIGRDVRLGSITHTIVGVMPDGFKFPVDHSYWSALSTDASPFARLDGPSIFIFGRLRDGVGMAQAQAELTTIGARTAAAFPATHARLEPRVLPYAYPILDIQGITGWQFSVMQATVTLLLVIVAINVAILIYARTATRQGEIAVRTALGASRRRIVGQLFTEALVLSGLSAAIGIFLARFGMSQGYAIMEAEGGGMPYWIDASIPTPAIVYIAGLAVLAAVIAGVLPALHATGRRVQASLKHAGASDGLRLGRTWTVLIVAQVALAVAGLPAAVAGGGGESYGLLTLPAFDDEAIIAVAISPDPDAPDAAIDGARTPESRQRFAKLEADVIAALEADTTVADVTIADRFPGDEGRAEIAIDEETVTRPATPMPRVNAVAPDFFDALDARLLAGRALNNADAGGTPVLVNRAFVRQILGDANAIGRRLRYLRVPQYDAATVDTSAAGYEIVGVVSDLMSNSVDENLLPPVIYHARGTPSSSTAIVIRLRGAGADQFTPRLRAIIAAFDPTARVNVMPFAALTRQQMLAFRLLVTAITLIVLSVLLLSAAGIYALMSFTVAQRRKEIGIRAAMGADARQLLLAIFSKAIAQLGAGVIVGVAIGAWLDRMSGGDLLGSFGGVLLPITAAVMILVGVIAAIGPARRSLRIQPTEALRSE